MSLLGRLAKFGLNPWGAPVAPSLAGTTGQILVLMRDKDRKILMATGTDVPSNATAGYAKGCLFIDRNVTTGTTGLYENIGTSSSCNFNAAGTVTVNEVTDLTATAAEINAVCDLTGRIVTIVETGAITEALHADRVCMLGEVGGNALVTLTLPEATGSGARYKFIVSVLNTSSYVIVVADTTNTNFIGNVINQDADLVGTIAAIMYPAPANADTITLNGTSTGGQLGDFIELVDVAADVWAVNGVVSCPAGSNTATPFSAAV
jgi:hypothetical protein